MSTRIMAISNWSTDGPPVLGHDSLDESEEVESAEDRMVRTQATLYLATVYVFICIVGLIANGAVLCMIARSRRLKAVTNVFIFNLALADLLYALCLPAAIYQMLNGQWTLGHMMCKLYYTCDGVSKFASVMFLVVLSFDRYVAVCHPIRCRIVRTAKIAFCTTAMAWTIVILGMVPVFLHAALLEVTEKSSDTYQCVIYWPRSTSATINESVQDTGQALSDSHSNLTRQNGSVHSANGFDAINWNQSIQTIDEYAAEIDSSRRIFTLYLFTLSFLAPLALVWIFYTMILHRLWEQKRRLFKSNQNEKATQDQSGIDCDEKSQNSTTRPRRSLTQTSPPAASANQRRTRSTRRVTIMVLSIVICYTVCWVPYWCVQITIEFFRDAAQAVFDFEVFTIISYIAYGMQSVNSMLNPFLYAFGTQIHRRCLRISSRRFIGLFGCRWRFLSFGSSPPRTVTRAYSNGRNISYCAEMSGTGQDSMLLCPEQVRRTDTLLPYYGSNQSRTVQTDLTSAATGTRPTSSGQPPIGYFLCCYCEKTEDASMERREKTLPETKRADRSGKGNQAKRGSLSTCQEGED